MLKYATKSGKSLQLACGTGTKWQWYKKSRPVEKRDDLVPELVDQLKTAINSGFCHIDSAEVYTTLPEVGEALKQTGVVREDMWLTSKYFPQTVKGLKSSQTARDAIDKALNHLNTDYLDLFLIHSPEFDKELGYDIEKLWKEFIEIRDSGKARYIGVSNFSIEQLELIKKLETPAFHQLEFHPHKQTPDLINYCKNNRIFIEGFCPLAPLFRVQSPLIPTLETLSAKYGKTDSQILLRYALQKGVLPLTTSSKPDRLKQALEVYEFSLDEQDVATIDQVGSQLSYSLIDDRSFSRD